ncbi:flavin reductase family protein [Pseudomonas sp. Gutcm_11s]|uniref:flavin reductase family protein n=1 Tax=Pseudomonas sp. Gutcm_11s TaxID=3026088 RepID=UPI00236080DC|nr:iron-sulfur cluster-binding domain-containing protein [Pseudomonas sp. Gutcm_11s]MDD0844587.1 iron-sulfur cluster-binding domain-containing protein [Pseudomonas sp. Gutcm_11s]
MSLLPMRLVRRLSFLLRPLRALAARGWLREAEVDAVLAWLHPAWRLNRVFARVVGREWVSDDLLAVRLRCNGNARGWLAGQHVQLYLELDGVRHGRSYSLTRVGGDGLVELGIRRQPGGRLSNRILDHLPIGALLELGQAEGELQWPQPGAGVGLLAAGSGITALLGLLREALAAGYAVPVTLLHYVREAGQRAYQEELQQLMLRHPNLQVRWLLTGQPPVPGAVGGRFQAEHLLGMSGFELLTCGPAGFVEAVRNSWGGALQAESFSPLQRLSEPGQPVRLAFARSRLQVTGDSNRSLLEQAEDSGLRPAHGCRQGICASCTCLLLGGAVRDLRSGTTFAEPGQPIRLCVSAPLGDVQIDL